MNEVRDTELGELLSRGSVAKHEDGYWNALRQAVAPDIETLRRPPLRKRRSIRIGLIAAVAAAAALFAFAVLPTLRGAEPATASEMLASLDTAAGSAHIVRLTITEGLIHRGASASPPTAAGEGSSSAPDLRTEQLTLSTSGDVRYSASATYKADAGREAGTSQSVSTYDEQRHEMRRLDTVIPDDGASVLVIERPSWGSEIFEVWSIAYFQALASSLRARLAEGDPNAPVTETTYLGRPAWHADLTERIPSSDSRSPDGLPVKWSVTVDKATGLLVASDFDLGSGANELNGLVRSFRVTRLEVDPELSPGWQRVSQAKQERIGIYDVGTRFGTPESVARRSWPTLLLMPRWVPAGYRLTDVATTDFEGMRKSPKEESRLIYLSRHHPRKYHWQMTSVDASVQRVVARYRRGFSMFVVEIRPLLRGAGTPRGFGSNRRGTEDVTLTGGYLKGRRARTSISPHLGKGPTLLTYSDRSLITITGDLTRQELIDVATSLKAYGDVDRPLPADYGD